MVEHLQNLPLHLCPVDLLLLCQGLLIHHLHRVQALLLVVAAGELAVAEGAEVDGADVSGADPSDKTKVPECQPASPAAAVGGSDGGVGKVGGAVGLQAQGQALRRGMRRRRDGELEG